MTDTIVVRAAGYRVKSQGGGRYNTFLALGADPSLAAIAIHFDTFRVKRNEFSSDGADVVSNTEANGRETKATQFAVDVEAWLPANHLQLT